MNNPAGKNISFEITGLAIKRLRAIAIVIINNNAFKSMGNSGNALLKTLAKRKAANKNSPLNKKLITLNLINLH